MFSAWKKKMFNQNENISIFSGWKVKLLALLLLCTYPKFLSAQSKENAKFVLGEGRYVEFKFQNDFFYKTDYYYSNGLVFNFVFPEFKKSPISKILIPVKSSSLNYYGISIVQELFTPVFINSENVPFNDRPYSSVLYLGHKRTSFIQETRMKISNEIIIGVIGRYSFGYDTQIYFHKLIKNGVPAGWSNQIANDLILNYEYDIELEVFSANFFELIGKSIVRVGTLYDDASVGMKLRLGMYNPNYSGLGQVKMNSREGARLRKFQFYTFVNPSAKMVFYNGTLQGGLFNKRSIFVLDYSDIKPVVLQLHWGFVLQYSAFQLKIESVMLSSEFVGGDKHKWMSVGLQFNL